MKSVSEEKIREILEFYGIQAHDFQVQTLIDHLNEYYTLMDVNEEQFYQRFTKILKNAINEMNMNLSDVILNSYDLFMKDIEGYTWKDIVDLLDQSDHLLYYSKEIFESFKFDHIKIFDSEVALMRWLQEHVIILLSSNIRLFCEDEIIIIIW